MRTYLQRLVERREAAITFVRELGETAARENRDLNETELELVRGRQTEVSSLEAQIEPLMEFQQAADRTYELERQGNPADPARPGPHPGMPEDVAGIRREIRHLFPTTGHYVLDVMRSRTLGDQAALDRARRGSELAARFNQIERAVQHITTADVPGLVHPVYTDEIIAVIDTTRPLISAMESRPLPPTGMKLISPRVTQRPQVGNQAAEKTEVASRKVTIDEVDYAVVTYAGYDNVSIQVIERSDPDFINELILLFGDEYARQTETAAITALLAGDGTGAAGSGTTGPLATEDLERDATAAVFHQAIVDAGGKVLTAVRKPADVLLMSIDYWNTIAGFVDSDGRPIYPLPANFPQNAPGQGGGAVGVPASANVEGLRPVLLLDAPADTLVVGWSGAFRTRENPGAPVTIRALEVGVLGWQIGVYGFVAFEHRYPSALVKMVDPTP